MAIIGQFTSRLSHEVRNPLTSVKLNLQRIERHAAKGRLPEECMGPLEISLSEVDRLDRVVRGVLSLARTGAPATEPCSVHQVLHRATAAVAPQLEGKGIEIEEDLEAVRDTILGNAEALEGVFLNLFLNAADAMPEGGRISIASREIPRPEETARDGFRLGYEITGRAFRPKLPTEDLRTLLQHQERRNRVRTFRGSEHRGRPRWNAPIGPTAGGGRRGRVRDRASSVQGEKGAESG